MRAQKKQVDLDKTGYQRFVYFGGLLDVRSSFSFAPHSHYHVTLYLSSHIDFKGEERRKCHEQMDPDSISRHNKY